MRFHIISHSKHQEILAGLIEKRILFVRGYKVMIDKDLAELYGVTTKALNQAVKRNPSRFPPDFMFRLNAKEKKEVVTNCDHLKKLKFSAHLPYVFTEHGALMLASILNSKRSIEMSLAIVRIFIKLRELLLSHKELSFKLVQLEKKIKEHDDEMHSLFEAIRQLMSPPVPPRRRIGFHP
jgi:hypothetical protein